MSEDDDLRYLFAQAFTTGLPSDECPTPEILLDAYHHVLPEPQRLLVIDHLAACAVCAEAWRLARQTTRGSRSQGGAS
ncbi:MAG: hypothetical protein KC621_07200 [Myxococcales bacterium]|nr:hypothetical protein [Myxococcales bacterium]